MDEKKIIMIVAAMVAVALAATTTIVTKSDNEVRIQKIKAGLEECPLSPFGISNLKIWVKDCAAYTAIMAEKAKSE